MLVLEVIVALFNYLLCVITVLIIYVSLRCFTDEIMDPYTKIIFVLWSFGATSELRVRFRASKTGDLSPPLLSPFL